MGVACDFGPGGLPGPFLGVVFELGYNAGVGLRLPFLGLA